MWETIRDEINEVIVQHVPTRHCKTKNDPKWMCREIENKKKNKKKAWSVWKSTKSEKDKKAYKQIEKETKKMIRNKKNSVERSIAKYAKSNPKLFYSYINSTKRTRSKIGPLKNDESVIITEPGVQAQMFNDYFSSVFTRSNKELPVKSKIPEIPEINDLKISEERVKKVIDEAREYAAPGPDGIHPKVIKELKNELAKPLSILFRKSIDSRRIPNEWKTSHVTPVFKKGKKSDPGNYRPINLTSIIGKMMDRIVKEDIDHHLESNDILSKSQHGFRSGKSTQSNLIEFLNVTTKWMDEASSFDVVYLDFSKAF